MNELPLGKPTLRKWFQSNLSIGALSFGGAGRSLLFQDEVVTKYRWIDEQEFREIFTVAAVFPGPNLVNLTVYLGLRVLNFWAATIGLFALAIPGAVIAILAVIFIPMQNRNVVWLSEGFSLASIIIFSVFIWRLIQGLNVGTPGAKTTFKVVLRGLVAVGVGLGSGFGWPLLQLLFWGGLGSCAVEFLI